MTTFTCKCKGTRIISTKSPPICQRCPYCATNIVPQGTTPGVPVDHNYVATPDSNTKRPPQFKCSYCGWARSQLLRAQGAT